MATVHYAHRPFPPDNRIYWPILIPKIGPAYTALAKYSQLLSDTVNPKLLLGPLQLNEAILSSRIEGTQAFLTDVMEFESGH